MSRVRVFVVDDHYVVCEGLKRMLEQEEDLCVVGDANSGEDALQRLRVTPADVVLLDARLTGMDGIETLCRLKGESPDLRVIMLTSYGDEFLGPAIEAGADGFLLKRGNRAEMVRAIHEVANGGVHLDSSVAPSRLLGRYSGTHHQLGALSNRETQVLERAAAGMSNQEIADDLEITIQTVKNHVTSILRKLDVNDRTHAVTIALRKGWIANPVPADWRSFST